MRQADKDRSRLFVPLFDISLNMLDGAHIATLVCLREHSGWFVNSDNMVIFVEYLEGRGHEGHLEYEGSIICFAGQGNREELRLFLGYGAFPRPRGSFFFRGINESRQGRDQPPGSETSLPSGRLPLRG